MKPYSLARRLVATVLLLEFALAASTTAATLFYERRQHLRAFDMMLRGRADSLLGAVQDAGDAADHVLLDAKALDLGRGDFWRVSGGGGRLVGQSAGWKPDLEKNFRLDGTGENFRVDGESLRGLTIRGTRRVDPTETSPGIARPVIVFYAASLDPVADAMRDAARFLLLANSLLLLLTGIALVVLLRRGLRPLRELRRAAAAIGPEHWKFEPPDSASQVKELGVLNAALSSAMLRVNRSFQQQQAFVHDAAHELKTAVAVVKSSLQLLASRKRSPADYAAGLESCLTDCLRMEDLVQRMLMLARFEQRPAPGGGENSDLAAHARDACGQLEALAEIRRILFKIETPAPAPASLSADACDTLVSNLILNALEHTGEGGTVTVSVTAGEPLVKLAVEDNGEGIGQEDLPHVFERFYRGDPSRSRKTGGTGLGLAIVKAIVDSAGGSIEIESRPGAGTRVRLELPAAKPAQSEPDSRLPKAAEVKV